MSFEDCIQEHIDAGKMAETYGQEAQKKWRRAAQALQGEGVPWHAASQMARDRVLTQLQEQAARKKHTTAIRAQRNLVRLMEIRNAGRVPDLMDKMTRADFKARGIKTAALGRMSAFLEKAKTDPVFSRSRDPALIEDVVRTGGFGEAVENGAAKAYGGAVAEALEWLRLMANMRGANIGKLDSYWPVTHSRRSILDAGYEALHARTASSGSRTKALVDMRFSADARDEALQLAWPIWRDDIRARLDWTKIENPATLQPFQAEGAPVPPVEVQEAFLKEVFDNIAFGREARTVEYGAVTGTMTANRLSRERVLHWVSADAYMEYNARFGEGAPMDALMNHIHTMSRDIALMDEFGPDPKMGLDFDRQAWENKAMQANSVALSDKTRRQYTSATAMMRVLNGPEPPQTAWQEWNATFFATTRQVISAAQLERAVVMAISDTASMRTAAKAVGMQPRNILSTWVSMMKGLPKDELARMQYIYQTWSDPGVTQSRFINDVGAKPWAQKLNNASMRLGGLAGWTDRAKGEAYQYFTGKLASLARSEWEALDPRLRAMFEAHRINARDWDDFRATEGMFKGDNGATFLMPPYWRAMTSLPEPRADEVFMKFGAAVEQYVEMSVPTQSLIAQAALDPASYGMTRGSISYELVKSVGQYKGFVGAMTENMIRMAARQPAKVTAFMLVAQHVATAGLLAAVSIQAKEILAGRDPLDMTTPEFMVRAIIAGGGLSIVGDLALLNETSSGGGWPAYLAGPQNAVLGEAASLTVGNLIEVFKDLRNEGQIDTNFVPEARKFIDRNIVPEPWWIGPFFDRILADQFQMLLDPESVDALAEAEQRRQNMRGNASWWQPGSALPARAPDWRAAMGR